MPDKIVDQIILLTHYGQLTLLEVFKFELSDWLPDYIASHDQAVHDLVERVLLQAPSVPPSGATAEMSAGTSLHKEQMRCSSCLDLGHAGEPSQPHDAMFVILTGFCSKSPGLYEPQQVGG
jgi:hypothetical protein